VLVGTWPHGFKPLGCSSFPADRPDGGACAAAKTCGYERIRKKNQQIAQDTNPPDKELSKALSMAGMRIVSRNFRVSQTAASSFDKGLTLIQREGSAVYSQARDISNSAPARNYGPPHLIGLSPDRLYLFSASHMTQASPVIDR